MTHRETFVLMVSMRAIARDIKLNTKEADVIIEAASLIKPASIPADRVRAARAFIDSMATGRGVARWINNKPKARR